MKKLLSSAIIATAIISASNPVLAARSQTQQDLLEGGTFSTLGIVGAIVGGPVGLVLGATTGAFLADQTRVAHEKTKETEAMQASINTLETNITTQQQKIAKLEQSTIDKLVFQIMFETGKDTLNKQDQTRITKLAQHLKNNPDLLVSLDGHADPRGTDEYNNVLAHERAQTVLKALIDLGVDNTRIQVHGHGASYSSASQGDLDQYALERRVDIEVRNTQKDNTLVQH